MSRTTPHWLGPAIIVGVLATGAAAQAATQGSSPQGYVYLEGGIGSDDNAALDAKRGSYSLGVVTAVRGSGAYLADVDLRISDARGAVVLERHLQGPRLMIALPPGKYTVQASYRGQVLRRETTIGAGSHQQSVFDFAVEGDVLPKGTTR
ncbi:carboxypeptidase regulatory-like domain-containing protein [Aquabacterium sp.]|uniref:carboxypeptidase regulatory-like domain-containing protein n=1 Tax=Aquabacterium sp. TaxID=1872578 RepID=UPI002C46A99E|nr:carboxypeptidase regulatory-like domain-containing protein [Aquabacterium sp.]HSV71570.1 carboxypeptidase regulatory-like domain-containing protein [Methylibium sp.]HSW05236.1 carboxypeptidase regulatory-like domain-containing protein [Aquabacterium sp.]